MQLLVLLPCYVDTLFSLYLLRGNITALVVNAYVDVHVHCTLYVYVHYPFISQLRFPNVDLVNNVTICVRIRSQEVY